MTRINTDYSKIFVQPNMRYGDNQHPTLDRQPDTLDRQPDTLDRATVYDQPITLDRPISLISSVPYIDT